MTWRLRIEKAYVNPVMNGGAIKLGKNRCDSRTTCAWGASRPNTAGGMRWAIGLKPRKDENKAAVGGQGTDGMSRPGQDGIKLLARPVNSALLKCKEAAPR